MKFLSFALLALFPLAASADWREEVNVPAQVDLKKIAPVHLSYELSWNGKLKAGELEVLFGVKDEKYPGYFICRGYGGSTGWARALYESSFNYTAFLVPSTLRPVIFSGNEKEKGELKSYTNKFTKTQVTSVKSGNENGVARPEKTLVSDLTPALDLFSGLLQIRSMALNDGDTVVMPFFPVSRPYLARVKVLAHENFAGRPAIRLQVHLQKIDADGKLVAYKKLKSAELWISDDAWRVPVQIRAKVLVGDVRVTLVKQKLLKN